MKYLILPAALILLMAGCKQAQPSSKLPAPGETIPVTLAPVLSGNITNTIETTGLLSTEDESKLSFKVGGVVESVYVTEGDFVKAGQVLATLKSTEIASQVSQVELNVQKAERDYQRVYNLFEDSVATLEQLQNAKTGLDIARQALAGAKFNQQYARIYAPANGFVVKKLVSPGEIAGPGIPVFILNHVSGNSHWVLKTGLSDAQWARVALGDKAVVRFDAFPGKQFEAKVTNRALAADPANGSFVVELRINFGGEKPATGMFGKASIVTNRQSGAQIIPYAALLEANGEYGFVFVTPDKKTVRRIPVRIGKLYPDRVEISGGLENENWVIISGSAFLSEKSNIVVNP